MAARIQPLPALLLGSAVALVLALGVPPAHADEPATTRNAAGAQVSSAAGPDPSEAVSGEASLRPEEIFEILKGGADPSDPGLIAHLRRVAESLARGHWTPPRVTVQVVVTESAGR
jgi:hypothetical protein